MDRADTTAQRERIEIALAILAFTFLGFWVFPGHTYLQSDMQIYAPMLERLWDPSVLQRDFMVERPHMAFTFFDEAAVALRRLTGLGFREVLAGEQIVFRALAILGVFLTVNSFGIGARLSLLATGVFSLGATIWGPTVLTFEYEPIPRAFALALVFLAIGLEARGWPLAAGAAASAAFLFHGPTAAPYWACYGCLVLWPAERSVRRHRLLGLAPLAVVGVILGILSVLQPGRTQSLLNLTRLTPAWEQALRLRSPYLFVSLWFPKWYYHYAILAAVCVAGYWRVHRLANPDLRVFLAVLPVLGLLSVPASWVLLEAADSALAPQLQPMRALLFVTAVATLLVLVAGIVAARQERKIEAAAWFLAAYIVPTGNAFQEIVVPDLTQPAIQRRLLLVLVLAAGAVAAVRAEKTGRWWRTAIWAAMVFVPFFAYPMVGRVENYPRLQTADLDGLSRWARSSTPVDSVFLFPDAKRDLYPGIFRAEALRAVYVDWKTGGQANYQQDVAREWWRRWQAVRPERYRPGDPRRFTSLGVDYVVLRKSNRAPNPPPVFENDSFMAYRVR